MPLSLFLTHSKNCLSVSAFSTPLRLHGRISNFTKETESLARFDFYLPFPTFSLSASAITLSLIHSLSSRQTFLLSSDLEAAKKTTRRTWQFPELHLFINFPIYLFNYVCFAGSSICWIRINMKCKCLFKCMLICCCIHRLFISVLLQVVPINIYVKSEQLFYLLLLAEVR